MGDEDKALRGMVGMRGGGGFGENNVKGVEWNNNTYIIRSE